MVVDASVAVKWAIDEIDRDSALQLLSADSRIVAPDLLISEVANVVRKKMKLGQLTEIQADEAVSLLGDAIEELLPASEIVRLALSLAVQLDHSVYDCIYLACALHWGGTLVTADRKFHAKCQANNYAAIVVTADEWWARPPTIEASVLADLGRLTEIVDATRKALTGRPLEPLGSAELRIVTKDYLEPLRHSPAYRNLEKLLLQITPDDVATLLALAWLGRGYGNTDWSSKKASATDLVSGGVERHLAYIIGLMNYVPDGWIRWQQLYGEAPPSQD